MLSLPFVATSLYLGLKYGGTTHGSFGRIWVSFVYILMLFLPRHPYRGVLLPFCLILRVSVRHRDCERTPFAPSGRSPKNSSGTDSITVPFRLTTADQESTTCGWTGSARTPQPRPAR